MVKDLQYFIIMGCSSLKVMDDKDDLSFCLIFYIFEFSTINTCYFMIKNDILRRNFLAKKMHFFLILLDITQKLWTC